jgi:hypothetical protein
MFKSVAIACVVSLSLLSGAASAAPLNLVQVEQKLRAAGYTHIHDIERDDGLWEADVVRADGRFAEVWVDPANGEIFDEHDGRKMLTAGEVLAHAAKHGLRDINDLEREGATWELEARDARGRAVDVRLSGIDGRVLRIERDYWFD